MPSSLALSAWPDALARRAIGSGQHKRGLAGPRPALALLALINATLCAASPAVRRARHPRTRADPELGILLCQLCQLAIVACAVRSRSLTRLAWPAGRAGQALFSASRACPGRPGVAPLLKARRYWAPRSALGAAKRRAVPCPGSVRRTRTCPCGRGRCPAGGPSARSAAATQRRAVVERRSTPHARLVLRCPTLPKGRPPQPPALRANPAATYWSRPAVALRARGALDPQRSPAECGIGGSKRAIDAPAWEPQ